jgi:predicted phosphoribosyltransferase
MRIFRDRYEAGGLLADELALYSGRGDVLVLALPRGGVPVGFEVAKPLHAPLDVMLVRKLGVPGHEELAMGAIASGGIRILNEDVVRRLRIPPQRIEHIAGEEIVELERRESLFRQGRPPQEVGGRAVLLIDDGLATGSTMRAAVAALRRREPARIVAAVPVGARETCELLAEEADEVVCLCQPENFQAVGFWYEDFTQTTDEEVCALLRLANKTIR